MFQRTPVRSHHKLCLRMPHVCLVNPCLLNLTYCKPHLCLYLVNPCFLDLIYCTVNLMYRKPHLCPLDPSAPCLDGSASERLDASRAGPDKMAGCV